MTDGPGKLRVLVTGASGFVGAALVPALLASGHHVRAALRVAGPLPNGVEGAVIGDLGIAANRSSAFAGIDAVVHGAGLMPAETGLAEAEFDRINTRAALDVARTAARAGVKRFVFLSSVRAQVGPSAPHIVTEDMAPEPTDAFGRSKLAAERALADAGLPVVVLRPVTVHGPGMRFNMARLLDLARSPWPLPFGAVTARRSILARDHLVDAVLLALEDPAMAGGAYLVADPEPLSVGEMIAVMRRALGRPPLLAPVPGFVLDRVVGLVSQREAVARMTGPLVVDPARLMAAGWRPRCSTAEALAQTVREIASIKA